MIRFLSAVLTLSAVGLSVGLAQAWDSAYRPGTSSLNQAAAEVDVQLAGLSASEFQLAPQGTFDEFISRPLFNVDRRPYEPPAEEPSDILPVALKTKGRQTKMQVSLTGVVINGDDRFALLSTSRGGSVVLLRAGDVTEGWELTDIYPDSVKMTAGGTTTELVLRTFEAPPAPKRQPVDEQVESAEEQVVARAEKKKKKQ